MWLLYAFLSAITAAGVAIFAKLGLSKTDTILATTLRAIIMAAFFVIVSISLQKFKGFAVHDLNGRQWLYIALAGLAGALSWLFYFASLKLGPASKVAAIDRLSIVFVLVFALLFLGEKFSIKGVAGAALIASGAILMSLK